MSCARLSTRTAGPAASLLVLLAACAPTLPAGQAPVRPPHIVYIYADDLGYGELGSYGQSRIRTPHLDRLAAEGLRFTQHYASSPVCAPSRSSLLTGLHTGRGYIRSNYELGGFADDEERGQMPLHDGARTIAHVVREAGYATAAIGKWGLGMHDNTGAPTRHGFDLFFGYLDQKQAHNYYPTHLWENETRVPLDNPPFDAHQRIDVPPATPDGWDRWRGRAYAPDAMADRAIRFLREHRDQRFFLYLPSPLPHVALQAPDDIVQSYADQFDDTPYLGDQGYLPTRYPRATYAAMITALDLYVGRVLDTLDELGLADSTLVLFSSDNGPTFNGGVDRDYFQSTGGLRGGKTTVYEGGIRVPFLARWPGHVPAGRTSAHLSAQYDLLPTLVDLVGASLPAETDGVSMLPALLGRDEDQRAHAFLYFEYPGYGGQVAVRLGRWKGVKQGLQTNQRVPWELYDLEIDAAETTDVATAHPDVLAQLDAIVAREHRHAHIVEWDFVDTPVRRVGR